MSERRQPNIDEVGFDSCLTSLVCDESERGQDGHLLQFDRLTA